ncbi:MAG: helix-turn-helix domain-containing protein [Solirubrobacteraceae bacterium]
MPASRGNMETKRALALAGLIRQGRRAKHWTQRDLAQAVPIGQTSISRYERANQGVPPDETIVQIARALDADPRDFLRAAGRLSGETFETAVLDELLALRRHLEQIDRANATTHAALAHHEQASAATRDVLARIEAALRPPSPSR